MRVEVCSRAAGLTRCAWIMKQCLMAQQEYGFRSSHAVSKFGLASIQQKRSTEKDIIWGSILPFIFLNMCGLPLIKTPGFFQESICIKQHTKHLLKGIR